MINLTVCSAVSVVFGIWYTIASLIRRLNHAAERKLETERGNYHEEIASSGNGFGRSLHGIPELATEAATLDDVAAGLDALERNNARLAKENAELRNTVKHMGAPQPVVAVAVSPDTGNPVRHAAVAPSPPPEHAVVSIGGAPIYSKVPGGNSFVDNTSVTLYGHVDVSGDIFNPGVFDQGTKAGVSSNLTYFGVRARHNLEPYGFAGWAAIAQFGR